jgi:putative redox protein
MPPNERVSFAGSQGAALAARLDLPEGAPIAGAVFAHCFTCSKDSLAASRISRALAKRGFAVLRFDFTGLGGSGGDFANTSFTSNVDDLVAATGVLRARGLAPSLLIGHSLGGAAVLAAAGRIADARAVATIGAPAEPAHVTHHFGESLDRIAADGAAEVSIGGRSFRIGKGFVEDVAAQRLEDCIRNLRKALLVLHAPRDEVVGIDSAARIFAAAKHPKSFVSLDDADHLITRMADADYVAGVLAAWASRYVGAAPAETPAPTEAGVVIVEETGRGKFSELVRARTHRLAADEPTDVGGADTGPNPYEYLLAGLGACTTMTLRMYIERKGWTIGRIATQLRHDKIHARDCADCETKEGMVDRIERAITVDGPLTEEQRAKLLEIADKCPVHRTLTGEIKIATRWG